MISFLTKEQREELLSELRLEKNRKYADRIRVILLLDKGKPAIKIAEYLFLDETRVRNYEKRYKEGGLERLVNDYYMGRSAYLSPGEQKKLVLELERKIYLTTKEIIFYVKKEFGVVYMVGGMTSLLHQLGFSYKKPKGIPGKAKVEEQKAFVKKYNRLKKKGDLIYFADSTHPKEKKIHLILDNAPCNRSNQVKDIARELKIQYLPAYSPNLNPIERLWKYMKKEVMANRYFPDLETFQRELMLFLRGIRKHKQDLSTLITDNFHIVKT